MKTKSFMALAAISAGIFSGHAQATANGNFLGGRIGNPDLDEEYRQQMQQSRAQSDYNFVPSDPWREIDGKKEYAKGDGWVHFVGKVVEVQPGGVRFQGFYFKPEPLSYVFNYDDGQIFFVANFPYECAENEVFNINRKYTAKQAGVYTYTTVLGGSSSIRKLDYGKPCDPPADLIQARQKAIADAAKAAHDAAQKKKAEAAIRVVQWLIPQATNGDASAQCDLGQHYLTGDGVEMNKPVGLEWLTKSMNQGNAEASNLLTRFYATNLPSASGTQLTP